MADAHAARAQIREVAITDFRTLNADAELNPVRAEVSENAIFEETISRKREMNGAWNSIGRLHIRVSIPEGVFGVREGDIAESYVFDGFFGGGVATRNQKG